MANNELNLAPCPLCGDQPKLVDMCGWEIVCDCGVNLCLAEADQGPLVAAWNRRAAPAQAEPSDALPGMPQPAFSTPFLKEMFWVTKGDYYTADQMRAYAKQAIEATRGGALSDAEILLMGANLKPFQAATYRTLQGQQMTQPEQQSYDALMLYTRAMESRIRGQQGGVSDAVDAARYRFLRHADLDALAAQYWGDGEVYEGVQLDIAIDEAIAAIQAQVRDAREGGGRG